MSNKYLKLRRDVKSIFSPPSKKKYKNRLANRALRRQGATKIVNGVAITSER